MKTVKCMCFPKRCLAEQVAQEGEFVALLHCFLSVRLHLHVSNAAPWNLASLAVGPNVLNLPSPLDRKLKMVYKPYTNIETKKGSESSCPREVKSIGVYE